MNFKLLILSISLLTLSCNQKSNKIDSKKTTSSYSTDINRFRQQKDIMFATDENSPFFQLKDSIKFEHLNYFEPDENYLIKAKVIVPEKISSVQIYDTKGGKRDMTIDAVLKFSIGGNNYELNAYGSKDDPGMFFIPFKDKTNGITSYKGGRYLEIKNKNENEIVLDFNYAFNPYCHYNHQYSCPVVPIENTLEIEIPVGEKSWSSFIH